MDDLIHLETFLAEERAHLEAFAEHWRRMQKEEPDHYPTALAPGDWDEQLRAFSD